MDLCILCGCDYAESIDGVGPVTAFKLMKTHGNLDKVLDYMRAENKIKSVFFYLCALKSVWIKNMSDRSENQVIKKYILIKLCSGN